MTKTRNFVWARSIIFENLDRILERAISQQISLVEPWECVQNNDMKRTFGRKKGGLIKVRITRNPPIVFGNSVKIMKRPISWLIPLLQHWKWGENDRMERTFKREEQDFRYMVFIGMVITNRLHPPGRIILDDKQILTSPSTWRAQVPTNCYVHIKNLCNHN